MAANYSGGDAAASGCPKALVIRGEVILPEDQRLTALLEVLGVSWQVVQVGQIASHANENAGKSRERVCVISAASRIATLLGDAVTAGKELPSWMTEAESVYIYGFTEDTGSQNLLRFLTGD